jgi:hypothetical protein
MAFKSTKQQKSFSTDASRKADWRDVEVYFE